MVIDCAAGQVTGQLTPPAGHHFNGHGAFLQAGALLATSEQRADTSDGMIGLWETEGWSRVGELPTGGLGPHEVLTLPDDASLIVANGGIATDPTDRTKLNLPTMAPSLALLDLAGGAEVSTLPPDLHQLSIRHLAARADGLVAFAMQWEGEEGLHHPLLGMLRPGEAPVLARLPEEELPLMQGYAGSVAWSGDGAQVAITSPRGGRVQVFDALGSFVQALSRTDVCGIASRPDGFLLTDGAGALINLTGEGPALLERHDLAWDNHAVALKA
jgi:uncharacterized protein